MGRMLKLMLRCLSLAYLIFKGLSFSLISKSRKFLCTSRLQCRREIEIDLLSDYFTKLFRSEEFDHKIAPYFLDPHNVTLNYGPTSIINEPAEKLTLDMINFDYKTNLKKICRMFDDSNNFYRDKPLYVINQGHGRGTTRILEEIKMVVNKEPDCLAIAITYGYDWALTTTEIKEIFAQLPPSKGLNEASDMIRVSKVFSVIIRMTAMLYGCSLAHAIQLYKRNLAIMPGVDYHMFDDVLVGFVKALVGEVRLAGRPVSKVLFLIDESALVRDVLKELATKDKPLHRDIWQVIRDTLLGPDMLTHVKVTTGLVLATVDYSTLGLEVTNRMFLPLVVPESNSQIRLSP